MTQLMTQPPPQPECFGKLWDASASECTGGYDPAFVGLNGSKTRPKCDFFDSCKVRLMIAKSQETQQRMQPLIPPQALMRQQPPTPWQPQPLVPGRPPQMMPQPAYQPPQQQMYQYPQVVMPPVQMQATNFSMPAYLSTPEVRREGESFFAPLGREIFRATGKAFGHTLAAFFDHVSFGGDE